MIVLLNFKLIRNQLSAHIKTLNFLKLRTDKIALMTFLSVYKGLSFWFAVYIIIFIFIIVSILGAPCQAWVLVSAVFHSSVWRTHHITPPFVRNQELLPVESAPVIQVRQHKNCRQFCYGRVSRISKATMLGSYVRCERK